MSPADEHLAALLAPHKVALLAIERQAQLLMTEAIAAAEPGQALRVARRYLKAVQISVGKLSYNHASSELAIYGIETPDKPTLTDGYIKKLLGDLKTSLADPYLTDTQKAQRAGLAAVSAANRYYTETQQAVYAAAFDAGYGVEKVWTTTKTAPTPPCAHCAALDGTVVGVDALFTPPAGLTPYTDLDGPPAHPNCRCRIVPRITTPQAA